MTKRDLQLIADATQEKANIISFQGNKDLADQCFSVPKRLKAFIDLVSNTRESQRVYFQDRTKEHLEEAKALERMLDEEIKVITRTTTQPNLFDQPPIPQSIWFFANGSAAVGDQFGKQMPKYQEGNHTDTIELLQEDSIDWQQLPEIHGKPLTSTGRRMRTCPSST